MFQTHVNEHLAAVERSLERRGRRPLELLFDDGILGPQCLLAHVTLLTPTEITMLRDTDAAVSYNPVASAWKGNAVADALTFAAHGIRFGLGTDATRGDGFRLMDAAETAQRLAFGARIGDSSTGGGWTWLDHATAAGADAAGLTRVTGSIADGRGRRLPAGRPRRAGDAAVMGPGVGAGAARQPGPDPCGRRRRAAAAVAGLAGRLGRPAADRRGQASARGRSSPEAPVQIVHPTAGEHRRANRARRRTESPGMSTYALIGVTVLIAAFVQGSHRPRFRPDLRSGHRHGRAAPAPGLPAGPDDPAQRLRDLARTSRVGRAGTTWISLGRFVGTFGGLGVLFLVTEQQLSLLIGVSTVLAVLMTLLAPSFEPGKGAFLTAGLVTGVTETSTGVGGPPLALVYQHRPAPVLRSTVAACFLIGEVISLVILAVSDKRQPRPTPGGVPAAARGGRRGAAESPRAPPARRQDHALPRPGLRPGLRRRRHRPSVVTTADEARGTSTGRGTSTDERRVPARHHLQQERDRRRRRLRQVQVDRGQRRFARPRPDPVVAGGDPDVAGNGSSGLLDRADHPRGEGVDHRTDAVDVRGPVEQVRHLPPGALLTFALVHEHHMVRHAQPPGERLVLPVRRHGRLTPLRSGHQAMFRAPTFVEVGPAGAGCSSRRAG